MHGTITRNHPPKSTPWGQWQSAVEHIPGIVFVSTASHGGFHLDSERRKEARIRFGKLPTFTGSQAWLEEDCDSALVFLIWAEHSTDEQIHSAVKMVEWMTKQNKWLDVQEWINNHKYFLNLII